MLHESDLEQKLTVTDVDTNFESIYEKDYIPQKYIEDINLAMFQLLKSGKYEEAWRVMDRIDISMGNLRINFGEGIRI